MRTVVVNGVSYDDDDDVRRRHRPNRPKELCGAMNWWVAFVVLDPCTAMTVNAFECEVVQSPVPCVWFLREWLVARATLANNVLASSAID